MTTEIIEPVTETANPPLRPTTRLLWMRARLLIYRVLTWARCPTCGGRGGKHKAWKHDDLFWRDW